MCLLTHAFSGASARQGTKLLMMSCLERGKYNKHSQKIPDLLYRATVGIVAITHLYDGELQQDWVNKNKLVTLHVKQARKCLFLKFLPIFLPWSTPSHTHARACSLSLAVSTVTAASGFCCCCMFWKLPLLRELLAQPCWCLDAATSPTGDSPCVRRATSC